MKKLVVLGGGESGVGAARLGTQKGWQVFVSDSGTLKPAYKDVLTHIEVAFEEGKHSEDKVFSADLVIKSPGIPDEAELIKKLGKRQIPVISEIEFGARYSKAKLIGITGSNGKTTTAMLTHHILRNAGLDVELAGNVGNSFCGALANSDHDYFVLELSSFQLDGMNGTRINIAMLLNITEDHLDRYGNEFGNYIRSKFRITQNQEGEDAFIYCADDKVITEELKTRAVKARKYPFSIQQPQEQGAELIDNQINIKTNKTLFNMSIQNLALQGKHNIYNSMASGIAGRILEIRKEVIRDSLSDFQNIEHRLEPVVTVYGVEYINDSKATNVNSTWYALETMDKPVIWIVGGVDKGNDYAMLKDIVKEKVKAIVCLGKDNDKIKKAFGDDIEIILEAGKMVEAVSYGYQLADKGDAVLLSPACASFDLFENYEDRGRQFKEAVRAL